jgi:hypothetical protein
LGLFFLLIDVDRTGSDRPCPTLRFGKHKYGFHAYGADPPHLRLRPVLSPRAKKFPSQKGETQMTNHYVATVPVKYTDGEGAERTRFQRVGAMFRNTRNGDGSEFFSLKLDFPVGVQELVMFPPSSKEPQE